MGADSSTPLSQPPCAPQPHHGVKAPSEARSQRAVGSSLSLRGGVTYVASRLVGSVTPLLQCITMAERTKVNGEFSRLINRYG
jgi:hypothetical protein